MDERRQRGVADEVVRGVNDEAFVRGDGGCERVEEGGEGGEGAGAEVGACEGEWVSVMGQGEGGKGRMYLVRVMTWHSLGRARPISVPLRSC